MTDETTRVYTVPVDCVTRDGKEITFDINVNVVTPKNNKTGWVPDETWLDNVFRPAAQRRLREYVLTLPVETMRNPPQSVFEHMNYLAHEVYHNTPMTQ